MCSGCTQEYKMAELISLCIISKKYDPKKATFGNILYHLEQNHSTAKVVQANR
jgi:hypothetical protein